MESSRQPIDEHAETDKAYSLLRQSMLSLTDIPETLTADLFRLCRLVHLSKGAHFVRAGDRPDSVGFNLKGILRYYYLDMDGNDTSKGFSIPGRFVISYSALAKKRESFFSIEALNDVELLVFRYADWMSLADRDARWYRFFFKLLETSYVMKEMREKSFLQDDAATRYANFNKEYPGLEAQIRQHHIASFLGITPEALSRIKNKR